MAGQEYDCRTRTSGGLGRKVRKSVSQSPGDAVTAEDAASYETSDKVRVKWSGVEWIRVMQGRVSLSSASCPRPRTRTHSFLPLHSLPLLHSLQPSRSFTVTPPRLALFSPHRILFPAIALHLSC